VILALYTVSFVVATPGYLSYFNFAAGGARGGWRYLLDSNIDWGQDLLRLRAFMDENDVDRIHLAYFGTADPLAYGIDYSKVVMAYDFYPRIPPSRPASGDWFACSVTMLQVLYWDREFELAQIARRRGLVSAETIDEWLARRNEHIDREEWFPGLPDWLVDNGYMTVEERRQIESGMLATWLDDVRENLTPVAYAGDSIRIYRIP